jgi:glucan-binding YG repeat protein
VGELKMNKNIKRIIALTLIFATAYAVAPNTNIKIFTTKAYAATTNTKETLDSLKLESSGGSNIKLYDDDNYKSSNKVDSSAVTKGSTYYAQTDYKTVSLSISGPSSSYVKVFKGTSSSTKGKSASSDISISPSSTTTLVIRVYSTEPDSNVRYDNKTNVLSEYKIKVKCTSSDSSNSNSDSSQYDNIYLEKLSVNGQSISLSESKILYSYNVDTNISQVSIKAEPQSSDDIVRIDGSKVYEDDDYKKTVSLSSGENQIKIEVENEDNDENRIYTLSIIKEAAKAAVRDTEWVQANGRWVYIDETGVPKKNVFFNDKVNGKTYYLQYNGYMATGWCKVVNNWYYFGVNGAMQTGWILDGGKYYYLYNDGTMAANTQIGPYIVDGSGAWIR